MESLGEEITKLATESTAILTNIWSEMGMSQSAIANRQAQCKNHVKQLLDDMIREETATKQTTIETIAKYSEWIEETRESLGSLSQAEESLLLGLEPSNVETILIREKRLKNECSILKKIKSSRLKQMTFLATKMKNLAKQLAIKNKTDELLDSKSIPSCEELALLSKKADSLTLQKDIRHAEFCEARERIARGLEELGESPDDSFVTKILQEDNDFRVTEKNMKKLAEVDEGVSCWKESRSKEHAELTRKVKELWDLTGVPESERRAIEEKTEGLSKRAVDTLENELNRLKQFRKNSLKELLEKKSKELLDVQTAAKVTLTNPVMIGPDDQVTEEQLDSVAVELKSAKSFLEKRRPILELLEDWQTKLYRLEELEEKAKDPSRLKNRGGNLLAEEKEKRVLGKKLPKIMDHLSSQVESWKKKNETEFLLMGVTLDEYTKRILEDYELKKEQEQHNRQRKRKMETETETRYGTVNPMKANANAPKRFKTTKASSERQINASVSSQMSTDTSTTMGKSSGIELKVTPWGSMRYSPNKPPTGEKARVGKSFCKNMSAVGSAIRKQTSKLVGRGNSCKTTDNIKENANDFKARKLRRRSKSESCIRDAITKKGSMCSRQALHRLPLPSSNQYTRCTTKKPARRTGKVTGTGTSDLQNNQDQDDLHGTSSLLSQLSETIECRPVRMEESVSSNFMALNQNQFMRDLLTSRSDHARSSMVKQDPRQRKTRR